jgi:thymidine kinase
MINDAPFTPACLEIFTGPMKSKKSQWLFNKVDRLKFMTNIDFAFFKPDTDTRDNYIYSRCSNIKYECVILPAKNPEKIFEYLNGEKVILLDETQFFGKKIVPVVYELINRDLNIVVAGLDLDYTKKPFGSIPELLAMAHYVEKLWGICEEPGCNEKGRYTRRNYHVNGVVAVENNPDMYSVTCKKHHSIPLEERM